MAVKQRRATRSVGSAGVLICTYHRPDNLRRCLEGLAAQTRLPDEVLVVVRDTDDATRSFLARRAADAIAPRVVLVHQPGLVAARNAGLEASRTDVLCMTDDDAVPRPDWLARITEHFASDPQLGGLGGRDQCFVQGAPLVTNKDIVGKLLWNGKHIGNHNMGWGTARVVDCLKGVNMSYRREAFLDLRFDPRLRGIGSQACDDLAFSRAIALQGWTLKYDPQIIVDHYEAERDEPRHYASQALADRQGFSDSVYNQYVAVWDSLSPLKRLLSFLYFAVIGTRAAPGLLQAFRFTPRLGRVSWQRFSIAQRARAQAFWTLSRGQASRDRLPSPHPDALKTSAGPFRPGDTLVETANAAQPPNVNRST